MLAMNQYNTLFFVHSYSMKSCTANNDDAFSNRQQKVDEHNITIPKSNEKALAKPKFQGGEFSQLLEETIAEGKTAA
jgi:hypothetical protein